MVRTSPEFREFRSNLIELAVESGRAGYGKNSSELSVSVAGTSHRQQPLWRLFHEDGGHRPLTLIREVGNLYSARAIAVISEHGRVGSLPDEVAAVLSPHLDAGVLQLEVIHGQIEDYERNGKTLVGARIEIRLYPWSDDVLGED